MDFEQLRIFLVLAEERTFLGAANRLGTSRSRVRRKLDQLEADAGTPLVTREQTGLTLTPAGETLQRRGRALLDDAEHLIAHVRDVGNEPTGCLKIAMPFAPPPVGWNTVCRRAQEQFSKLRIEFIHAESPASLLPTRAELALSFEPESPNGCSVLDMGDYEMRLVVSDAYLATRGAPHAVDDLTGHRLAVWRVPGRDANAIPLRSGQLFRFEPALVSEDPSQIYGLVTEGSCIAYLPALPQFDDPALKPLFPEQVAGRVQQWLAVPSIFAEVPRVQRFVEMCRTLSHRALT